MQLIVNKIKNKGDFYKYFEIVDSFSRVNPFCKILGINLDELVDEELCYFTYGDTDNTLVLMPFLLRKIIVTGFTSYYDVSSPYGYSGPLFNEDMSRAYLLDFWEAVDVWYKSNNIVTEFIRFSLSLNHQFYTGKLVPTLNNVNGIIQADKTIQWDNFKAKVRNNYRKAVANNLSIKIINDPDDLEHVKVFYDIYITTMRRLNADKSYFFSLSYFENIIRLNKHNYAIAYVYKDDVAISTELIFISGHTLYSYLGGTLSDYFDCRPNDFLKIQVMKWARKNKHSYYVLGGGRQNDDSLYKYKKTFFPNDEDVIFYTGRKVIDTVVYKKLVDTIKTVAPHKDARGVHYFPKYRQPV
jgi:hypothetical protein